MPPPQEAQLMNNYNNTAYKNPVIQQHPHAHNAMNHMAANNSYNSFTQELNSFNEKSKKTVTK